ncbi:MAG: hypothetical protein HGA22_10090, partial [Clostridiales bacterium]|nr:hypothetical protein [Clostridiales bacterium]
MLYAIIILSFITVFLIFKTVLGLLLKNSLSVKARLDSIGKMGTRSVEDNELNQSLGVRVLRPLLDNVSKQVIQVTPVGIISSMAKKIT